MKRRTMLLIGIMLLLGMGGCMLAAMVINFAAGINDAGSPELASEWKATLAPLTPSAGEHTGIEVVHFPNGEWIIGFAQNSHGRFARGGGTLVVKDSRGETRAFFGHVCGAHFLQTFFRDTADLDRFYARLHQLKFAEHTFP